MMEMLRTSSDNKSKKRRGRVAERDWCMELDVVSWRSWLDLVKRRGTEAADGALLHSRYLHPT